MNVTKMLWILPVLFLTPFAWADPCGTGAAMDLNQRIKDCGGTSMVLVMNDNSGHVIKMDDTGLLWGDRLDGSFTFEEAQAACNKVTEADGYPAISGVSEKWRLPTAEEFAHIGRKDQSYFNQNPAMSSMHKDIQGNGSWKELPNMKDDWYWSSSPFGRYGAWGFSGFVGYVISDYRDYDFSVRCVARR